MSTDVAELERAVTGTPANWRQVTLGEVVRIVTVGISAADLAALPEVHHYSLPAFDEGAGPEVGPGGTIKSNKTVVPDDCVLFSKLNPRIPRIWRVRGDAPSHSYCSTEFWPLVAEGNGVDLDYLTQYLSSAAFLGHPDITPSSSTNSHQRVDRKAFERFEFSLPPLDEQRRIAEVLRSVDAAIAMADGVARQWATTIETLIEVAFAEGKRAKLGDICSLIYRYPGFYGFDQLEDGIPVIRGEHLRAGRISTDWTDFYFVDPAFSARFPKTILKLDDVVMSVRGTVGTTAVVDAAHVGSQISPNLIRLVADPATIMPPLLYYAVQSAVARMRRTIVNAQALPAINAGDLKRVEIALPSLEDQPTLLAELHGAALASADAVSAAQQARRLKASLMFDLLSGRVRVPA